MENMKEQIGMRAYYMYLQRGCLDGFDQQDWYQAETEMLPGKRNAKSIKTIKEKKSVKSKKN
jgi:hypothetical protein